MSDLDPRMTLKGQGMKVSEKVVHTELPQGGEPKIDFFCSVTSCLQDGHATHDVCLTLTLR